MELLLFWALCGVVAAVVASNRGNSGVAWFFVGVLLGPIGLILSLVVSGDPAVVERKKIENGGYRRCEKCAELIRAEATKCRFCGSDVAKSPVGPASGSSTRRTSAVMTYQAIEAELIRFGWKRDGNGLLRGSCPVTGAAEACSVRNWPNATPPIRLTCDECPPLNHGNRPDAATKYEAAEQFWKHYNALGLT